MKLITLFGLLLVVLNLSEQSEYTPVCPNSKVKTYHEALLPNSDFYVCEDGSVTDFIKCDYEAFIAESKCDDDPCCEKFSRENEIIPKQTSHRKKRNAASQPILTKENILWFLDTLQKDYGTYMKQVRENESLSTEETKTVSTTEAEVTSSQNIELENIDMTTVSSTEPVDETPYLNSELPTNIPKSSEKLKSFTKEVVIPIIEDIVNDHSKMSSVASLFRKYLYTVVPLVTDVLEQLEAHPRSSIKLPRKRITDAINKIQDEKSLFKKVSLEIMPSIIHKIGDNMDIFIGTMEEIEERFQINFFGWPLKYLLLYFDYSQRIKESSADEFITFQLSPEVRRDIKAFTEIVAEVTSDRMFSEKLNLTAIVFQLFFF